jgi:PTH1 family peptidyl-tRNA hydrolase
MRKLIVGLGNPGPAYARTRHNIGFQCVEELAARHDLRFGRARLAAEIATGLIAGQPVVLAKPQTFMNESGRAVAGLIRYYTIAPDHLLVVFDDLDLPFGHLRLRAGGSAGGHRGLQSIIGHLGHDVVPRLRVGIGRPPPAMPAERYVLAAFNPAEREHLPAVLTAAREALASWLTDGLTLTMNRFNGWTPPSRPDARPVPPP